MNHTKRYVAAERFKHKNSLQVTQNNIVRNVKSVENNKRPIVIKLTKQGK